MLHALKDKTVLVAGGTGFIGHALCEALYECGARVFVLTRTPSKVPATLTAVTHLSELPKEGMDAVINLAGERIAQRWTKSARRRIWDSRILVTRTLVDYMRATNKKPLVFISASAVGYYGTHRDTVFDEEIPSAAPSNAFAHQLCAAWEREALEAKALGIRTVLLRLGPVLGQGGGMLEKLILPFRLGLGGPLGSGNQWLSWIAKDDVIPLIMHLLQNTTLEGPVNAVAPNPVTNGDFSRALAKALRRPCVMRTPAFMMRLIYGQMAQEIMLEGQKVVPVRAVASGFSFTYPRLEEALQACVGTP